MADQPGYPQIPTNVWWGVRAILGRNPRTKFDDTTLAVQLEVQPAAGRQYLAEMKKLGVVTDEGNATDLALRWRMDETYRDATNEMMTTAYPEQLIDLAPPGSAERAKVENWFMMKGLGQGTAKNKAATYILLANADPTNIGTAKQNGASTPTVPRQPSRASSSERKGAKPDAPKVVPAAKGSRSTEGTIPLNLNIQIHISADASSDQIESIFSAMRKYLHGDVAN